MNGFSIYETYKQSQVELDERHRALAHQPIQTRRAATSLRQQAALRGGMVLLKWAQALLRYGDTSAYRADTRA